MPGKTAQATPSSNRVLARRPPDDGARQRASLMFA
jgi:hypothetical protein